MFTRVKEIEDLALNYSKNQLASLSQQGLLPAQTAVLAGMMQDRMQAASIPAPTATVAEKILGASPTPPQGGIASVAPTNIASVAPQTGINQPMSSNMPTQEMAYGGLAELDTNDMYDENSFAGGGIIAFANRGLVEDPNDPYKKQRGYDADTGLDAYGRMLEKRLAEKASRGKKGLAGLEIEDTPATRGLMQSIFGSGDTSTITPESVSTYDNRYINPALTDIPEDQLSYFDKVKSRYGKMKEKEAQDIKIQSEKELSGIRNIFGIKGGYSPTKKELDYADQDTGLALVQALVKMMVKMLVKVQVLD
jgi:hypothetical protein